MEVLLLLLLLLVMSAGNVACFVIGVKVGQATAKGEEVKLPVVKPAEPVQEHQVQNEAEQEAEMEKSRLETIMQNVDNYDGTDEGQVDVPWR